MSRKTEPVNEKVEAAIAEIERRYAIGQAILQTCGPSSPAGLIKDQARKHGINRDICQKLRAMASPETGYTPEELKVFFAMFREAERALTISHFVKLVSVPKGKDRDELTRQAMANRWSSHRLQAEIVARLSRRKRGSRTPTEVSSKDIKPELDRVLWSWQNWIRTNQKSFKGLSKEVEKEVLSLRDLITKIQEMRLKEQSRK